MVRIMCGAAVFDSVGRLTGWLYTAEGNTRQQLRWSLVSTAVTVAAVLGAAGQGAVGVTWAFAASTAALAIPGVAYCLRSSALTSRDFVAGVWRPVVAATCASAGWALARDWLPGPNAPFGGLVVDAAAFAWLYVLAWILLPGGRQAVREAIQLLRVVTAGPPRA